MPRRPLHPRKFRIIVYLTEAEDQQVRAWAEQEGLDLSVAARTLMKDALRTRDNPQGKGQSTDE